jgi:Domain of unknown function (DUF4398)
MDQAQGAIDAARAAGADRYATTEYAAATDALKNANEAVAVRDYRLALNYALESREQAQNAARGAADAKARRLLQQSRADLAAAEAALQKAGEAVAAEDYLAARTSLDGVKERVIAALGAINQSMAPRTAARRR